MLIDTDLSFSPLALRIRSWTRELATHPDVSFRDYILDGLANSFALDLTTLELLADNRVVTCRRLWPISRSLTVT